MTLAYPTAKIYIDWDGDGVPESDISNLVTSVIEWQNGIFSYKDTDRIASIGSASFVISDGDHADFQGEPSTFIGKPISIRLVINSREKQIWFGYITNAKIDSTMTGWPVSVIKITARDWINVASNSRVGKLSLGVNMTADEALPILLATAPNSPYYNQFQNGYERFPNMFDGALRTSVIFAELDRLLKSELGYLYLLFRNNLYGETLAFENYLSRTSIQPISKIPLSISTNSYLKYHGNAGASGRLKFHGNSGTSGLIKLDQAQDASFTKIVESDWPVGENVVNQMSVNNVPRKTDTSLVVLYKVSSPIQIGTSQKFVIDGSYSDPNGGTVVQASEVVVSLSDIAFNSNSDGSGTNLIANIQVNGSLGTNSFQAIITNNGPAGYLTSFQVRGKGRYKYSQIETLVNNITSQNDIMKVVLSDSLTREYSNDYNVSKTFANGILAIDAFPRRVMANFSSIANMDENMVAAVMYLDQGSKVQITEGLPSHTGNYFIQGIKGSISLGGVINFTWALKESVETICQPIAVRAPVNAHKSAIDFGILPYLANLKEYTYSAWIKRNSATGKIFMIGKTVDDGSGRRGNAFWVDVDNKIYLSVLKTPTDGLWQADSAVITSTGVWYHVAVTYVNTSDREDANMFVNGSAITVFESITPSGITDDDNDCPLVIFNLSPDPLIPSEHYKNDISGYSIKDVRIYGRILTNTEISTLASNENNYSTVQDGLLFSGIYAVNDNIDTYINDEILADDLVIDSVYRAAGVPYNEDESASTETLYGLDLT